MTATGKEAVTLAQLKSVVGGSGGSSDGTSCYSVDIPMSSTVEVGGFSIQNNKAQALTVSGIVGDGFLAVCGISSGGELSYSNGTNIVSVRKLDGSNVSTARFACAACAYSSSQYSDITRIESNGIGTSVVRLVPSDTVKAYAMTMFVLFV